MNGTKLDDRVIRCDWDIGFREGRQYGRGKSGGQVRDEYRLLIYLKIDFLRSEFDAGRGGYGKQIPSATTPPSNTQPTSPVMQNQPRPQNPNFSQGLKGFLFKLVNFQKKSDQEKMKRI